MIEHVNKPFVVLLIIAVIIGVSIGGVFAGGVAFGKASDVEPATALALGGPRPNSTDGAGQGGQGQFSRGPGRPTSQGVPQRQPGQFDPPPAIVPPTAEPGSGGAAVQSFPGRGGLSGTIENIEGNVVTIATTEGPVAATINETTSISQISAASVDDLQPGMQVTVMGPAGEDGSVAAADVVITPEGLDIPFGGGQRDGRGSRRAEDAP